MMALFSAPSFKKTRLDYLRDGSRDVGRPRAGVDGRQAPFFFGPGLRVPGKVNTIPGFSWGLTFKNGDE